MKKLKLFIHPKAESDLMALLHWLAVIESENAKLFKGELEHGLIDLTTRPDNGIPLNFTDSNLGRVSSIGFREFPVFRLFYRATQGEIQIIRLLRCPVNLVKDLFQNQSRTSSKGD